MLMCLALKNLQISFGIFKNQKDYMRGAARKSSQPALRSVVLHIAVQGNPQILDSCTLQ
jgi:hypothetical protein